ncbi:MAG: hypothetical protein P1U87_14555 [Verrucomicrobiales bacterium]|nr:hypothetical protein [Verrucomicrobiales bacterium]
MKSILLSCLVLASAVVGEDRHNILFIAVDDLRPDLEVDPGEESNVMDDPGREADLQKVR